MNKNNNLDYTPINRIPTSNNPMMNVQVTDYDNPQVFQDYFRYDVYKNNPETKVVKKLLNTTFNEKLFQDPADIFFKENNSQRQFYSMPVGNVYSDQTSFAESLYGVQNNCKNGSIFMRYNLQYTDDSLMCNGYNVSTPTNFGNINSN
jgi:hypothetical protein